MSRVLLFIDDDLDVRSAYADLLEFTGWQVVHAADGHDALEWLKVNPAPGVILLDLKMPRMDGYEFRRVQLADARWRDIPTVIFTADANVDPADSQLGGAPVVTKSAPFADLRAELDKLIR